MSAQPARRFWTQALAIERQDGWGIALDGRAVKAPSKRDLRLRSRALAEAVAAEWNAQGERLKPETMPLTRLANTASDRVPERRQEIVAEMLRHVDGDVLCYFADGPEALAARQRAVWLPLLDWAGDRFGARWRTVGGLMPVAQDAAVHAALAAAMANLDHEDLTALQVAAPVCGSLVVGFALVEGRVTAAEAFAAAFLDECHQAETWGEDAEAAARRQNLRGELEDVERFLCLVRAA
jgi:chaperone required for assembly of F1-ATPase